MHVHLHVRVILSSEISHFIIILFVISPAGLAEPAESNRCSSAHAKGLIGAIRLYV